MTRLVDTFLRSNRNLLGLTPDTWSWVKSAGADSGFQVRQFKLARKGDSTTWTGGPNVYPQTGDQFVELKGLDFTGMPLTSASTNFIIRLRIQNSGADLYSLIATPPRSNAVGTFAINQTIGGVAGTAVTFNRGAANTLWDKMDLRFETVGQSNGTRVTRVLVNGVEEVRRTDNNPPAFAPSEGVNMGGNANSARVDDAGFAFYADQYSSGDVAQPSRYVLEQVITGGSEPLTLTNGYIEMVLGETGVTGYGATYSTASTY